MTFLERINIIERIDSLIQRRGTGTPHQLATRLNVSERYVYKLINQMKEMGAPIYFCNHRNSYCYEIDVVFSIGFVVKNNDLNRINGGFTNIYEDFLLTARFVQ